jgi:uncharacterized protein (TIGR03382 family)
MKTNHPFCGLISGLLLPAAGAAQTHSGLYVPAGPNANLYVSNPSGNTIEKFSSTGTYLGVFANTGFSGPVGPAFDSTGNLYTASNGDNTIAKFSPTGTGLSPFANSGLSGPSFLAFDIGAVPEPGTVLFGLACVGVAALRRRRRA